MSKKLFLVKVGRKTRSGNIQELITRSIAVPEEASIQDVYNYFVPRYTGFDVRVEQPQCEEIPDMPVEVRVPKSEPGRKQGCLAFKVKYNDEETALFEEYCEHMDKAREKERHIENSIRERYGKLPYVRYQQWYDIELTTDTASGTFCKKLPIKSNDFFKVIKDCDDGTAELEITENTGSEIEHLDIPF